MNRWLLCALAVLCSWTSSGLAAGQDGTNASATQDKEASALEALAARTSEERKAEAEFMELLDAMPALREELERQDAEAQAELVARGGKPAAVVVPDGLTLAEAEAGLAEVRAAADVASEAERALEAQAVERATRRNNLPSEIAIAREELKQAKELQATAPADADRERIDGLDAAVDFAQARLDRRMAEQAALAAQSEVLILQRDAVLRRSRAADAKVAAWVLAFDAASQAAAGRAKSDAEELLEEMLKKHPTLEKIATANRDLATERSGEAGITKQLAQAAESVLVARGLLEETEGRRRFAARRDQTGELTEGMAAKLRRDFEWLPRSSELRAAEVALNRRLTAAEIRELNLVEDQLLDPELRLAQLIADKEDRSQDPNWTETALRLLRQQRDMQASAIEETQELQKRLYEARRLRSDARAAIEEYRLFIEARILWVRSASLNPLPIVLDSPETLVDVGSELASAPPAWLVEGPHGRSVWRWGPMVGLLLAAILLLIRRRVRARIRTLGEATRSYKSDAFHLTLRSLFQTMLHAAPWPLALWVLGEWFDEANGTGLARSAGVSLRQVAIFVGVMAFAVALLRDGGVGHMHFRWRTQTVVHMRRRLAWYIAPAAFLSWLALTLDRHDQAAWSNSLGRLSFLLWMTLTAILARWLMGHQSPVWEPNKRDENAGLFHKAKRIWITAATGAPVLLGVLCLSGYYYTALQFEQRILNSVYFLLALLLVHSLLLRWLFISRRRLVVAQALEARKRRKESEEAGEESTSAAAEDVDQLDIPAVNAQTQQLFKSSLTLASVLGLYFIWTSALPALQQLDRVQLLPRLAIMEHSSSHSTPGQLVPPTFDEAGPQVTVGGADPSVDGGSTEPPEQASTNEAETTPVPTPYGGMLAAQSEADAGLDPLLSHRLTLGDVLLALIFLALTHVAVRNLPALLELALLQRLPLDGGARYAITTIVRYLILLTGVTAVSGAVGIGWRQVQWLAAALTFGLAFGLQEIFANFVSGLIILIERPVRVGDIVTVGGTEGRVTQLRMRATTILDWDRREYLIPNKEFITGSVINWTLSDPVTRVVVSVGVAYGTDTDKARALLLKTAQDHRLVLEDPVPTAIFRSFGDSTLDFELRVFIANRDLWHVVIDELHSEVDKAFRAAGIEIAFPQRDVHLTGELKLDSPQNGDQGGAS